jgi:multidrug resistance efflux pump
MRAWILFLLLLIGLLVAYYILSDRYTPFTTDAYVQAFVIQVAPHVEGQVVGVYLKDHQAVKKGDLLFEIDPRPFAYKVNYLEAKLVDARYQIKQMEAELAAARHEDVRLTAEEAYAKVVHGQEKVIFQGDATTDRKYEEARQKHKAAQAATQQSLELTRKAELALEARIGEEHAQVAAVQAGRRGTAQSGVDAGSRSRQRVCDQRPAPRRFLHPHRKAGHNPYRQRSFLGRGQLPRA